jgi:alcohol dehydrogenase class IV
MGFAVNFTSCFELGEKGLERAFAFLADKGAVRIFVLADPFITDGGLDSRLHGCRKSGQDFHIHCSYSGEPKQASVQAVLEAARAYHADGLIGIGGGSVLDTAKIVKTCLHTGHDVSHFVMQANPLPAVAEQIPSVMIPTTAGTGSEASGTNILTLENGRKGWVWGPQTKPSLSILDPSFSLSLPPHLTAWTGMDVLVHAFESATNQHTHAAAQLYSHEALQRVAI